MCRGCMLEHEAVIYQVRPQHRTTKHCHGHHDWHRRYGLQTRIGLMDSSNMSGLCLLHLLLGTL